MKARDLTTAEKKELLKSLKGRYKKRNKLLMQIGFLTGFRISELLSFTVADVMRNGAVRNEVTIDAKRTKNKKDRTVKLNNLAQRIIKDYLPELKRHCTRKGIEFNKSTYLFQSQFSGNRNISRYMAYLIIKSAMEYEPHISTHSLRKSFGMDVYRLTKNDIFATMTALGHSDTKVTQKYLSINEKNLAGILEKLAI